MDSLDEDGRDENGIFQSYKPYYDRLGVRCVNFLLFFWYTILLAGAITGIALPCIWPNTPGPVLATFLIVIGVVVLHFLLKIVNKACNANFLLYPVQPKYMYMIADGVLAFTLISVVAAYVVDTINGKGASPIVPMIGAWVTAIGMIVNWHMIWRITYEGPAPPPPIEYIDEEEDA